MADPGNVVGVLMNDLGSLSKEVRVDRICSNIKTYEGDPSNFKHWIRNIEKAKFLLDLNDNQTKLLALQSSTGNFTVAIERHLKQIDISGIVETWEQFKNIFKSKFAEVANPDHAMFKLTLVKQLKNEPVALFAEKIISIAEDAHGDTLSNLPIESNALIKKQVINIFTQGLFNDAIRARVIRENPSDINEAINIAIEEQSFIKMIE